MGRSLISPSFSARLLLFRAFGEGGVVVHYSTAHHHPLQQLPGQSAELCIDQYDLLQEHPSIRRPARFVFFSSLQAPVGTSGLQWPARERQPALVTAPSSRKPTAVASQDHVRRLRLGSRLKRCVFGRPAGTTSNCFDTHGEAFKSGRGILREKAERGNGFNKALRASWEFRPSRNLFSSRLSNELLIGLRGLYNKEVVKLWGFYLRWAVSKKKTKKKRKAKVGDPVGQCPLEAF